MMASRVLTTFTSQFKPNKEKINHRLTSMSYVKMSKPLKVSQCCSPVAEGFSNPLKITHHLRVCLTRGDSAEAWSRTANKTNKLQTNSVNNLFGSIFALPLENCFPMNYGDGNEAVSIAWWIQNQTLRLVGHNVESGWDKIQTSCWRGAKWFARRWTSSNWLLCIMWWIVNANSFKLTFKFMQIFPNDWFQFSLESFYYLCLFFSASPVSFLLINPKHQSHDFVTSASRDRKSDA